jgi:hypothetical protein
VATVAHKRKKEQQLGMPWSTASSRLDRLIMFWLAQQCGKDTCHHCGEPILTIEDFSVEHKKPWLDVDSKLFWDLSNIAFSHLLCNNRAGRKPTKWPKNRKEVPKELRIAIARKAGIAKRDKSSGSPGNRRHRPRVGEEVRGDIEQHAS